MVYHHKKFRILINWSIRWGSDPPRGRGLFWGSIAAHCKVMGHSTVSCAKTAEPIDMPFWIKILVGPRNHVLDGGADPPREKAIFGVSGPFKSIGHLHCSSRCSDQHLLQKGSFNR